MAFEGTVVNGLIVLDAGAKIPEGARVRVELADDEDHDPCPPMEPYDREKELALLRESIEDMKAGRTEPFEEFMARLAKEFNLPPVPPE